MALFPITQFDVPNVSNYDSDLRELLHYYEQLVGAYSSIVSSYEELTESFEALQNSVNDFMRSVDQLVQDYVDEATAPMWEELESVNNTLERLHQMDLQLIQLMDQKDTRIYQQLFNLIAMNTGDLLLITADLKQQIDDLEFTLPDVFNPATGSKTSISQALMDMWDALRSSAYTALSWDTYGATASELDGLDQTALWWDTEGGKFIDPPGICRNPLNGEYEPICEILQDLAALATGDLGLTATDYDAADLTASTYEDLNLSAYQYDFMGSEYIQ